MRASGRTLTVDELLSDSKWIDGIYVLVNGEPVPVVEADNGVLSTDDTLFTSAYENERDLLEDIAQNPRTWTKTKILKAIRDLGISC